MILRADVAFVAILACALLTGPSAAALSFERGVVRITQDGRDAALSVEIARNARARAQGLMNRTQLAENAGMLFVFKGNARRFFWMKNTRISLSLAFIDSKRTRFSRSSICSPTSRGRGFLPIPPATRRAGCWR